MAAPRTEKKLTIEFDPPLGAAPGGPTAAQVKATMTEVALSPRGPAPPLEIANPYHMDVQRVVQQTRAIQQVMSQLMKPGVHYGVIPGTEKTDRAGKDISKPTLYQPGADLLCMLFRLRPKYEEAITEREGFYAARVRTNLIHIQTGEVWGEGLGEANSREARYLNQIMRRVCPSCSKPTIFKSRDPGGGWFCWRAKEGCGATFPEGDPRMGIDTAQVNNDKVCDLHNTILKIACKRSKVGGVLTATAASEIFTQDLEDLEVVVDDAASAAKADKPSAVSAAGKPAATNPQPTGNPLAAAGPKRASPIQVRDLNLALAELHLGVADADKADLRGREREAAILAARLQWVSQMLAREVPGMVALGADEVTSLIGAAKAGEMPGGQV